MHSSERLGPGVLFVLLSLALPGTSLAQNDDPDLCASIPTSAGEEVTLELVTDQLTRPVDATAPAGDLDRLFVVEHAGVIRIVDLTDDSLLPTPFLDIRDRVSDGGEAGLLGLAFHPDYAENGVFFVDYTSERFGSFEQVLSRFSVDPENPHRADGDSEVVLLHFGQPRGNHNGGQLAFSPIDGHLYLSVGDGGKQRDPDNNAQNPLSYLGKILRLDVTPGGDEPYTVPPDNPFVDRADVLPEIWAIGFRNPWRFSFDSETGDLYVADVGQSSWEEVSFLEAPEPLGYNFEWRVLEGDNAHSPSTSYTVGTRVSPILEYPHSGGAYSGVSVTGGYVYRGCSMPDLHGRYFFADYGANWVRSFRVVDGEATDLVNHTAAMNAGIADFDNGVDQISSFGTDARGEVYICDLGTKLFRIVSTAPPAPPNFVRADANDDGGRDIGDAVFTLLHLFRGTPAAPACEDAVDSNDDGTLDIADAVHTLGVLFLGTSAWQEPVTCGADPTPDDGLDCATSTCP